MPDTARECAGATAPARLSVLGFAGSRPFRRNGEVLAESDSLNLATANKRAENVHQALAALLGDQELDTARVGALIAAYLAWRH